MKYTTSRPKKKGFYFVIAKFVGLPYVGVCEAYCQDDKDKIPDQIWFEGENRPINDVAFVAFCGPIPEPEPYKADKSLEAT